MFSQEKIIYSNRKLHKNLRHQSFAAALAIETMERKKMHHGSLYVTSWCWDMLEIYSYFTVLPPQEFCQKNVCLENHSQF